MKEVCLLLLISKVMILFMVDVAVCIRNLGALHTIRTSIAGPSLITVQ